MDLLREWIARIAGIIILFTLCDMIMIEGTMKKYIKPIFGIVLVLAIIRPFSGDITSRLDFEQNYSAYGAEFSDEMTLKQKETIREVYENKLADETEKLIMAKYKMPSVVKAIAGEEENFGDIMSIQIRIEAEEGEVVRIEEIKKYLEKQLEIQGDKITIFVGKG